MCAGGLTALACAGRDFPQIHAVASEALRLLLSDLGVLATPSVGPSPAQPRDLAALAEAERAKKRAEDRAEQEAAHCADVEQQLLQCQQDLQTAREQRDALHAAAVHHLEHATDKAGGVLSAAAAPLVHWTSSCTPVRQRPSFATIWTAERPTDMGRFRTELTQLLQLWNEGGLGRRPGPGQYKLPTFGDMLTRIEAVDLPVQDRNAFYTWVEQKEAQRDTGHRRFNPQYPDGDRTGEKAAVLERLKGRFLQRDRLHKQNVLLAFHGCTHEDAESICMNGFAVAPYRDRPWFGKGLYTTTCVAARKATKHSSLAPA